MAINKPFLLTPNGLANLQSELQILCTDKREEVAARLQRAMEDGKDDEFVDNAELESARNDQSFLEGRIIEIEDMLRNYQLIETADKQLTTIQIGSYVTVVEDGFDEEERYHLVGAAEANPAEGRISNESPIGKALLGAKKGEIINVSAPAGTVSFKIVQIG